MDATELIPPSGIEVASGWRRLTLSRRRNDGRSGDDQLIEGLHIYMNEQLHAGLRERLPDVDFDHLIERAQRQRDDLEPFRARAAKEALGGR